jgi:hypothetical protein
MTVKPGEGRKGVRKIVKAIHNYFTRPKLLTEGLD